MSSKNLKSNSSKNLKSNSSKNLKNVLDFEQLINQKLSEEKEEEEDVETEKEEDSNLIQVDPLFFDGMVTDQGPSIGELNDKGYTLILYFMRALGCIHCNGALEDIYSIYLPLIKMNIYPVIIYKETKKVYEEYLEFSERTQRYKIFHSMNSKDYAKTFQLKTLNMPKLLRRLMVGKRQGDRIYKEHKIKNDLDFMKKNLTYEQQNISKAAFVVENRKIIAQFTPDDPFDR
jgi:hypothetical protein